MVDVKTIAEQLSDIYFNEEFWAKHRMTPEESFEYHINGIERGSIRVYEELGVVLGYYELWKINREQLNRITAGFPFCAPKEDVTTGNIAFLANVFVDRKFRGTRIFREMKKMFFEQVKGCTVVMGEKQKQNALIKMHKIRR